MRLQCQELITRYKAFKNDQIYEKTEHKFNASNKHLNLSKTILSIGGTT